MFINTTVKINTLLNWIWSSYNDCLTSSLRSCLRAAVIKIRTISSHHVDFYVLTSLFIQPHKRYGHQAWISCGLDRGPVSYTHLDVYKRQVYICDAYSPKSCIFCFFLFCAYECGRSVAVRFLQTPTRRV